MADSPDSEVDGDAISEIARRRREDAAREAARPKPEFIESVEQSQVLYQFQPRAIPYSQIDPSALSKKLDEVYGLRQSEPDLRPLLTSVTKERLVEMDETELLRQLVRVNGSVLTWLDGRFPLKDDFVEILHVSVNFESIQVSVAGVSDLAEVIAKDTAEFMWESVGIRKRWADIEPLIGMVGYGTTTRLSLGFGPECLLNPVLLTYLDQNLDVGNRYAAVMGRSSRNATEDPIKAIAALDELHIMVRRFGTTTGFYDESLLKFSVTARSDYRTGSIQVQSPMPYEDHVRLLREVFDAVHSK